MVRTMKISLVISLALGLLLLTACSSATPTSTPTLDLNPLRTEVASTVLAQVTRDLALTPSATPIPSSTATSTQTPTPTRAPSGSPSPATTITAGTPVTTTRDLAEWVSQSIADGTVFAPGETFTITWQLKNVGTSTWSVAYLLRFYSGDTFGASQEIPLGRVIAPGQILDISIPMKAPTRPGDYRTDWVLANESRSNFKQPVFLKITVAAPATPTLTPTATTAP
jgi:hypothetical protein